MEQPESIGQLRALIHRTLGPLVSRSCCLLDVPNHANSGDHFIYAGERKFLANLGRGVIYEAPSRFHGRKDIPSRIQLLLQGGGSFGDIYPRHHAYRERIVSIFTDHPILVFPQTVWFDQKENLSRTAALFSRHPNLTICARDARSLGILEEYFPRNRALLVPDMAFCLELPQRDRSVDSGGRVLCLWQRRGKEAGDRLFRKLVPRSADNRDWPAYERHLARLRYALAFAANRATLAAFGWLGAVPHPRWDATAALVRRPYQMHLQEATSMLREYDLVISERLHGHILACLMGIPSVLLDNGYGKNAAFHETWMSGVPGSYFAGSPEEFEQIMRNFGT